MSSYTTTDGCVIDYRDTGDGTSGETVVMLHGWSQSRAMFDRVIPLLSTTHRVITFDHRGHGESEKPAFGARIARLAADFAELLDHLAVNTATMAGHSLGASVLWSYLDSHGQSRVDRLILMDQPSACVVLPWMTPEDGRDAGAILDFAGAAQFVADVAGDNGEAVRRAFLESMLTSGISATDLEWMYRENLKLPAQWGARLLLDHIMQDWRDVLPSIAVPTLVTGGEVSHVNSDSQAYIAGRIPAATVRIFTEDEGGAHFPFFENPEPFARALLEFIGDSDSTNSPNRLSAVASS